MTTPTTPMAPATITTDFSKEDWEKWMNFDGQQQQQQQVDASTPGTYLSGSPPPLQFVSGSLGSTSPSELESLPPLAFSPTYALPTTASKKRKSSAVAGATPSGRQPRGQKISHNVIEKRYRSNLNDKIAKLRDSVPELRVAQPTVKRRPQKPVESNSDASGDEGGQGLKFNKATVLVKATEYIQQLERQNQRLLQEVSSLKNRFGTGKPSAATTMTTGFATATYIMPQTSAVPAESKATEIEPFEKAAPAGLIKVPADIQKLRDEVPPQPHYAPESSTSTSTGEEIKPITIPPFSEIQGMIPLPESWKAFRAQNRSDEHYAPPSTMNPMHDLLQEPNLDEDDEEGSRWSRSRFVSRVLVGSLAGLMVMEGFNETPDDGNKIEKRGLFSLPTELLTESRGFRDPIRKRIIAFAGSTRSRQLLPMFIFSFLFLMMCFAALVYIAPSELRSARQTKSKGPQEHIATNGRPAQNSIGITTNSAASELTASEMYAVRVLDWLNLSWLVFHNHDEEAAESTGPKRATRWTRLLLPRTLQLSDSSL